MKQPGTVYATFPTRTVGDLIEILKKIPSDATTKDMSIQTSVEYSNLHDERCYDYITHIEFDILRRDEYTNLKTLKNSRYL